MTWLAGAPGEGEAKTSPEMGMARLAAALPAKVRNGT
jgi:hypothetical protein